MRWTHTRSNTNWVGVRTKRLKQGFGKPCVGIWTMKMGFATSRAGATGNGLRRITRSRFGRIQHKLSAEKKRRDGHDESYRERAVQGHNSGWRIRKQTLSGDAGHGEKPAACLQQAHDLLPPLH